MRTITQRQALDQLPDDSMVKKFIDKSSSCIRQF